MGPFRLSRSSLSSTKVNFSLCLASELILLFSILRAAEDHPPAAGKSPPRCMAFSTHDRQLVVPPVHRVSCTPVPVARHGVVTCCDHFPPRRLHSVLQRPSRSCATKLIYEPGLFKMFAKLVLAESFCVPGGSPHPPKDTHHFRGGVGFEPLLEFHPVF